mgnify:CR=1 FL=1
MHTTANHSSAKAGANTFLACLSLFGCSTAPTKNAGFTASGQASFYADKFQNRKTASGELYQQDKHTAAHRSLAFGTKVKVTNTENGDNVVVRMGIRKTVCFRGQAQQPSDGARMLKSLEMTVL